MVNYNRLAGKLKEDLAVFHGNQFSINRKNNV